MNKQKRIEELAKDLYGEIDYDVNYYGDDNYSEVDFNYIETAKNIVEKGWIKPAENAVVMAKEEYEELKQYEEKVKSGACFTQKEWLELCDEDCKRNTENLSKARQLERKETAEKFITWLKENILSWGVCGDGKVRGNISITLKALEDFSKQFGDFSHLFNITIQNRADKGAL